METKDYIDNPDWGLPPLIGAKRHTKARGTGDGRSLRRKPYPFFLGEEAAAAVCFVHMHKLIILCVLVLSYKKVPIANQ